MMPPPSRSAFKSSRFYRCCLCFHKRNQEKLKNLQNILVIADHKQKHYQRAKTNRSGNHWVIPECKDGNGKGRTNKEDQTILSANNDASDWVFDEAKGEYSLVLGGLTVMKIPTAMYTRLKPFQRDAVKWIAKVGPVGGILADDMGMGKTFMSIAAVGARMKVQKVRMVLIVAPVSVLGGWQEEGKKFFSQFSRSVRVVKVHGGNQKDRQKIVRNAWKNSSNAQPYVIISSWGLVASGQNMKTFLPPTGHHWDYVVLDEAHEIKNHNSNRSKCCRRICHKSGTKRLLLTGTPFQNDTTELWSIMHMATAGKVLGKLKDFNKEYGKPIRNSRCRSASSYDKKQGDKANKRLQETLRPHLLRRKKLDFLSDELPLKREICVWVKPSNQQTKLYKEKVESSFQLAKNILSSDTALANKAKMGAFQVLAELRNLCGHPLRLLKCPGADIRSVLEQTEINTIVKGSRKLELVTHMLQGFKNEGHKTLLFSQSTKNLDIIQHVLRELTKLDVARLDGNVKEKIRQDTVEVFQNGMLDVLLLSTGAGGVGITLTRASRVIMFDPSWNPSQDAQAVDRAYRIGQTLPVFVYRMFVAGSIEEKMYEKQVHKAGLEKTIFEEGTAMKRFFDKHELCKVFEKIPDGTCDLLKRFKEDDVAQVPDAHRHVLVNAHSSVIGISNHGKVYNQKRKCAFSDATAAATKRFKEAEILDDPIEENSSAFVSDTEAPSPGNENSPSTVTENMTLTVATSVDRISTSETSPVG